MYAPFEYSLNKNIYNAFILISSLPHHKAKIKKAANL